jgi:(p)ppGpp synthase/HD superfamily hydrolase
MQIISEKKREEMLGNLLKICRSHLSHLDEDMISRAFRLSFEAHKNDFRASGEPYFIHPYQVALIVAIILIN